MNLLLEKWVDKIESISLRERAMVFAAVAVALISLMNNFLIEPMLLKQKQLSLVVAEQQAHLQEIQTNLELLAVAQKANANSPLRAQIRQSQQKIEEDEAYIKMRRDTLVPPEKVGAMLEQILNQNGRLQLISLDTLDATPMLEANKPKVPHNAAEKLIYQHGVKITLRGSYTDLLAYLGALEKLPTQMLWGKASMTVLQHPTIELTLTVYTLSLDTTWLQV
jgi:MSHA biogenesis protein MshJ